MGTYFTESQLSSCEVSGFIAAALVHDLRVNNFCFTNFPEVEVEWDDDFFRATLKAHGASSTPFSLSYETVKKEVARFREKKDASPETFKIIQGRIAELEGAVSKITDARR